MKGKGRREREEGRKKRGDREENGLYSSSYVGTGPVLWEMIGNER